MHDLEDWILKRGRSQINNSPQLIQGQIWWVSGFLLFEGVYWKSKHHLLKIKKSYYIAVLPKSWNSLKLVLSLHIAASGKLEMLIISYTIGFNPSTFVYSCFFLKIQFLYCLPSSPCLWGAPLMSIKENIF